MACVCVGGVGGELEGCQNDEIEMLHELTGVWAVGDGGRGTAICHTMCVILGVALLEPSARYANAVPLQIL